MERARSETTGVNTADESSLLSDSEAESNHDDDADPNDQDCAETLADSHPPRAWNVLPKHEMVDFAKDLNNMAEMRASGWTLAIPFLHAEGLLEKGGHGIAPVLPTEFDYKGGSNV
ncbi:hypothetical protein F442_16697 [Phytophthora nicotianae P10297]|uniref:Uncharacterized protein n=1 Tax=Phytophthora nicotianae P10297 TaxID=1317064 RepID=W2YLI2_PHYNI|nr:hypothetical protein F442_16697 [Phytophthora nicotianae P10297]